MLNLTEINNTIEELENGETTFAICDKLASLYIVRNFFKPGTVEVHPVEKEINDILPQYQEYKKIKTRYQMHEITEDAVVISINNVCREIKEFIDSLYAHTDMPMEREAIKQLITTLYTEKRV